MTPTTIADPTVDEFQRLIREVIIQTFSEMIGDPDNGLELRDEFRTDLH